MKTVVYHSADFDGIFCGEIAKKFLGTEGVNYIGWNFGDAPLPIPGPEIESVYVMDLPLDAPFGVKMPFGLTAVVRNDVNGLVWIDHHKSAIESHPRDIPGYRIDGVAACRLAWQFFEQQRILNVGGPLVLLPKKSDFIDRQVSEPLAVRLAGEYDVWDHRGDGDLEFQFGLDSLESPAWGRILSMADEEQGYTMAIVLDGRAAMKCYAKRDADVMRERSFLVEWEGLKWLALNTARCNSQTFADKDMPETGHAALLAFYWNGKVWTVSLYHARYRTDLDLSLIAVKYGGGGHRGACGFTCAKLPFI